MGDFVCRFRASAESGGRLLVSGLGALLAGAVALGAAGCSDSSTTPGTPSASPSGAAGGGAAGAGMGGAGATSAGGEAGAAVGGGGGVGGGDTCGIGQLPAGGAGGSSGRVRVVAANLTSGTHQTYDEGHGIRILQGLDADVVLMQEMNYGTNSRADIDELVDRACEGQCRYMRGPDAGIPNGVLSRLPMLACGSWTDPEVTNRDFVWARLDVPGSADLWAISVHWLSSNATDRGLEATALLGHIATNIPAGDLVVLGGDLNTKTRTEVGLVTLSSSFDTASPYPADQEGNNLTNGPRSEPYDWVLADAELAAHETAVHIGLSVFSAGAVIDTRVYVPLAEIAPAAIGDSAATGMQHMAVVKDFQLGQ